jgi:hypothetical protein
MLIGETTKQLAVGPHVFFPCFVGNSHVRVSAVLPVRLDLMQGNNYNSKPWLYFRFSLFQKPVRSIGIGQHLSLIHDDLRLETVLFYYSEDAHCFIKKDTSLKKKSQDLDHSRFKTSNVLNSKTLKNRKSLPMQLVSNDIVASEKTIQSLPINFFSFLNVFFLLFGVSASVFITFLFMNSSNTDSTSVKQLKPNDLEITLKNFNNNEDPNNKK